MQLQRRRRALLSQRSLGQALLSQRRPSQTLLSQALLSVVDRADEAPKRHRRERSAVPVRAEALRRHCQSCRRGEKGACVVIVAGSGPTDRDGNNLYPRRQHFKKG